MTTKVTMFAPYFAFLDEKLWKDSLLGQRSNELTPLFIQRFRGVRTSKEQTFHDFWELLCVRDGRGLLLSGAAKNPLEPHTICLLPPGVPHIEYSDIRLDLIWVGLRGSVLESCDSRRIGRAISRKVSDGVEQLWLLSEQRSFSIGPELDGLARLLLGNFLRMASGETRSGGDLIDKAIGYIHEHAAESLSMPVLAAEFGCSEGYFYRLFKQRTGRTPVALLTDVRIQRAIRLLHDTDMPVSEVARQVGYEDQFYFSRVFRKQTGVSPSEVKHPTGKYQGSACDNHQL